jgi:tight adherence protein B
MLLLLALVFIGVFLVAGLLMAASSAGASERTKHTLERLDAILASDVNRTKEELVNIRKEELLSAIPVLNQLLLRMEIAPKLRRLLYHADVNWTPGGLILIAVTAWIVGSYLAYLKTGVVIFSMILGLIPAAAPFAYVLYKRGKRFDKFEADLPAALDLMVTGLRSGQSLISVIGLVSQEIADPIGREFRVCYDEQNYGLELRTALENLAVRAPLPDVRIIVTAILIQKESGGNLAEVLEKCAHVIRERFRLKREIRTKTAQGRLTGWILTFLPIGLGMLLYTVNPKGISLLWTHPLGVKMLYTACVMTLIGGLVIRKIIRIRV